MAIFPEGNTKPYDMLEIIERIVDASGPAGYDSSAVKDNGPSTAGNNAKVRLNNLKKVMEKQFYAGMHELTDGL